MDLHLNSWRAVLVALCLVVAGCATPFAPHRESPGAALPEAYSGGAPEAGGAAACWAQSFASEALQRDIRRLRGHNLGIAAARARVEQARARHRLSGASRRPQLNLAGELGRSQTGDRNGKRSEGAGRLEALVEWELDIWGRLAALRQAADLTVREQDALREQLRLEQECELVEAWIDHGSAVALRTVLVAQRKTGEQLLELMELRAAQGAAPAPELERQRGRLADIDRQIPSAETAAEHSANAYAVLLGGFPGSARPPAGGLSAAGPLGRLPTPRELLHARPDLCAALFALESADQQVAAAVAQRLPRLSIGLSYGLHRPDPATAGTETIAGFTAGLLAPVFAAGRLRAEQSLREAEATEALALLEKALREAVREVEDLLAREESLRKESESLGRQIEHARRARRGTLLRYASGELPYLDVLDATRELHALEALEIEVARARLINRARLHKALGSEWSTAHETDS